MNSRTFKETLVSKQSIQDKYAELSKGTDKPLVTEGAGSK